MTEEDQRSQGSAVGQVADRVRHHPLDPLDGDEIKRAVAILRRERPGAPGARFVSVTPPEPAKDQVAFAGPAEGADAGHSATDADAVPREAFIVLMAPREHMLYDAGVALTG